MVSGKCYIDTRSSLMYGSFYVYGLYQILGRSNVVFNNSKFANLCEPEGNLRFILDDGKYCRKYFIHTNDSYKLVDEAYQWCDVYGHVNANFKYTPQNEFPKIVSLVPSFAIDAFGTFGCWVVAFNTLFKSFFDIIDRKEWNPKLKIEEQNIVKNIRHQIGRCVKTHKLRLEYNKYSEFCARSKDDYVFFLSTLWYNDEYNNNDNGVNKRRADFIRAVKNNRSITFEGGLLSGSGNGISSDELFRDVVTCKRLSMKEWLYKTKKSEFVFNTPAFWNCHGWKLGEYLALGKCIISTKLFNDLPLPLVHGKNIHFVDDSYESICEAISYIHNNPDYRHKLENGALEYWEQFGTPIKQLNMLGIH